MPDFPATTIQQGIGRQSRVADIEESGLCGARTAAIMCRVSLRMTKFQLTCARNAGDPFKFPVRKLF